MNMQLHTILSGSIRVVGGADNSQGRLEIYYNGAWYPVSEDDWNWRATKTACKELGYKYVAMNGFYFLVYIIDNN